MYEINLSNIDLGKYEKVLPESITISSSNSPSCFKLSSPKVIFSTLLNSQWWLLSTDIVLKASDYSVFISPNSIYPPFCCKQIENL